MGILDEDVQRVREATDLVALAGEHLALKRVGRSVHGLCPFHTEKSPSFTISPEKQVFYCLAGETRVLTADGVRDRSASSRAEFTESSRRVRGGSTHRSRRSASSR